MYKLKYKVEGENNTIKIPVDFIGKITCSGGNTRWKYSEIYEIITTNRHKYKSMLFKLISHDIPKDKMKELKSKAMIEDI